MRIIMFCLFFAPYVYAQEKITVGVKESPPFVINENGEYHGIAIGLAEFVLSDYNIIYEEYNTVNDLVKAVENQHVDVGVGAISITSSRDKQIDYTHSFKSSGISALYNSDEDNVVSILAKSLPNLFKAVTGLVLFIAFGGLIYWLLERKNEFTLKRAVYGIFNGLYWASATTTTVGYGDVSAQTKSGRVFSMFWMWISIFAMGTITATIVASVNSNSDSNNFVVSDNVSGVLNGSRAQELAAINNISTKSYYNLENMFDGLTSGDIDAIIHDTPILEYYTKDNNIQNVEMQKLNFLEDRYAFVTINGNDIIDSMNTKILSFIESTRWKKLLSQY